MPESGDVVAEVLLVTAQDPAEVRRLYREGVGAIGSITAAFDESDWVQPACGEWDAADTARHVLSVVDWYHEWLDRALDGVVTRPFPEAEIDQRTAAALTEYADLSGPEAVARFTSRADAYVGRVEAHWETTYAYPFGVVTAGLHCGIAAAEWHIHAWDLSAVSGARHEPVDADRLFVAAASCVAAGQGGIRGALLGRLAPLAVRRSPWQAMLKRSGR